MDLENAKRRYQYDPEFRSLVDMILHSIMQMQFTPSDVRDAAMYASLEFEMRRQPAHHVLQAPSAPTKGE